MVELYDIVDNLDYVATNCYQHQLTEVLDASFNVKRLTLAELERGDIPIGSAVISRLRLRTLVNNLQTVSSALRGTRSFIYEQDTWENFLVDSPYFGSYAKINACLSPLTFLNMSHWWAALVRSAGIPSRFIQVWTLPKYCTPPAPWSQRAHKAIFCGTLYPRRVTFFDALKQRGINVEVVPVQPTFARYLELLSSSRLVIRCDKIDWLIDAGHGQCRVTDYNALWQRDIEVAARGCFSMREADDEGSLWGIGRIPLIVPFTTVDSAVASINRIASLSCTEADDIAHTSVDVIRSAEGWMSVPRVIHEVLGAT